MPSRLPEWSENGIRSLSPRAAGAKGGQAGGRSTEYGAEVPFVSKLEQ
jgi:hypothetical protein